MGDAFLTSNVADICGLESFERKYKNIVRAYNLTRDNLGRITAKTETVQGVTTSWTYGYDAQDEILTSGPRTYQFNLAGQLTSLSDSSTGLSSQFQNSPINIRRVRRSDGLSISYIYDEHQRKDTRRVSNGSTFVGLEGLLYGDNDRPVGRIKNVNTNLIQSYQYLAKYQVPDSYYDTTLGHSFRVVSDERGSVRLVIDGTTGEVAQEMDYDEFGIVIQDTSPGFQPFGFAGGEYDPYTGFVNFGARDYDALTGRFVSRDPIFLRGGINAYSYALDDPVNFVDPSGLLCSALGLAGGACAPGPKPPGGTGNGDPSSVQLPADFSPGKSPGPTPPPGWIIGPGGKLYPNCNDPNMKGTDVCKPSGVGDRGQNSCPLSPTG